jgi:phosphoribosyl 1,2-cyclic phosphate phosphodiesterase
LRVKPSDLHFNVEEAIAFADRLGVKQAYLTHIGHEIDHETVSKILPPHIQLGFDGLRFPFG